MTDDELLMLLREVRETQVEQSRKLDEFIRNVRRRVEDLEAKMTALEEVSWPP